MPGALVFMVVMVLVMPVGVMLGGAIWSAVVGEVFSRRASASSPDS